jgi:hypothetical protein
MLIVNDVLYSGEEYRVGARKSGGCLFGELNIIRVIMLLCGLVHVHGDGEQLQLHYTHYRRQGFDLCVYLYLKF